MNHQEFDRRQCDRDPIDMLTPEVFALLKLCGGVRASDIDSDSLDRASSNRRRTDPREGVEAMSDKAPLPGA